MFQLSFVVPYIGCFFFAVNSQNRGRFSKKVGRFWKNVGDFLNYLRRFLCFEEKISCLMGEPFLLEVNKVSAG
jgi:hypothetical protein